MVYEASPVDCSSITDLRADHCCISCYTCRLELEEALHEIFCHFSLNPCEDVGVCTLHLRRPSRPLVRLTTPNDDHDYVDNSLTTMYMLQQLLVSTAPLFQHTGRIFADTQSEHPQSMQVADTTEDCRGDLCTRMCKG